MKDISAKAHKELSPVEIIEAFTSSHANAEGPFLLENAVRKRDGCRTVANLTVALKDKRRKLSDDRCVH